MPPNDNTSFLLSKQEYESASAGLIALKAALPRDAVVSMARDVLDQLASRVADPATRSETVIRLSHALISEDPRAAADEIEAQYKADVTVEALLLGYLSPAARQLGEWWEADEISFADVTVGTGRIYGIMRTLNRQLPRPEMPQHKAALVAPVPGETHLLGARMATDLLRDQGWTIDLELDNDHDTLLERIERSGHLVIGLSAAGEHAMPNLARLALALQVRLPRVVIFVGGNIVAEAKDQIALIGVDAMSQNYAEAATLLDALWERASARDI